MPTRTYDLARAIAEEPYIGVRVSVDRFRDSCKGETAVRRLVRDNRIERQQESQFGPTPLPYPLVRN